MLTLFDYFRERYDLIESYKKNIKKYYRNVSKEKDIEKCNNCALDYIVWLYEHDFLSINEKDDLLQYNEMCKKLAERKLNYD